MTDEIVPGVRAIALGYVSAFLIRADDGLVLVDSGTPMGTRAITRRLEESGGVHEVRHVVITHHHMDHVGQLAPLVERSGAKVWAHPLDAAVIRGERKARPESRNALERAGVWAVERFAPKAKPARVDHELTDGQVLPIAGELIAYHTPGHTAGHVSFLMPAKRILFVGDAAANYFGRLGPPFGLSTEDHQAVKRSIGKLSGLDFDVACFGHGRVLKGGAATAFRRLAEKVAG
jgi:glyoxylase-like metal-dependent hydrolase (beta-lactamase superfamily II)